MSTLDDLISIEFTPQEIKKVEKGLSMIEDVLDGKMVNLTPHDRQKYGRLNSGNEEWVNQVEDYMNQEPQLIPFFLSKQNFDVDMKARRTMKPWVRRIASINESLEDSIILTGSDIYNAALAYYRNIKLVARQNVPGSTHIAEELSKQFEGQGRAKENSEK